MPGGKYRFQSQTRSRPGCHAISLRGLVRHRLGFNLKREAAPVATARSLSLVQASQPCFNLKREAAPVATKNRERGFTGVVELFQSQTRSRPGCHPGRHALCIALPLSRFQSQTRSRPGCHRICPAPSPDAAECFNLKREAAPVATVPSNRSPGTHIKFQSQTRSRPGCHPRRKYARITATHDFNLKREAAPVATAISMSYQTSQT